MSELGEFRKAKNEFFANDPHSPLTPLQRQSFHGLDYYPENPDLRLTVQIDEYPDQNKQEIELATNTGDSQRHAAWGRFSFVVDGETVSLTVYQGTEECFELNLNRELQKVAGRLVIFQGVYVLEGVHLGVNVQEIRGGQ